MNTMCHWRRLAGLIWFGLVLSACGADEEAPERCDPRSVRGTYLVTFEVIDGTCGPQASALQRVGLDSPEEEAGDCIPIADPVLSDNGCKRENKIFCSLDKVEPGAYGEFTSVLRQQREDGSLLTGTMNMKIWDGYDYLICVGTYAVKYERQ